MPLNKAPRQLSTFLEGIQRRFDVPGISVPRLWGKGEEEFGIDYPHPGTDWQEPTEEGSLGVLERGAAAKESELTEQARLAPPAAPEPPSRQRVAEIFNETFGNPDTYDVEAETVKAMEEEDGEIKERLGIGTKDLRYVSPELKKLYTQRRAEREKEVYTRKASYLKKITEARKEKLDAFDAQMKEQRVAGRQARTEVREEERLGIARSAELRALGKPPTAKRVWDTKLNKYVQRTDAQITKEPDRYGMSKETALEMKKAGATTITLEKYGLQKEATAGNIRTQLMANKRDKSLYEASGKIFNITNTRNEITYWKTVTPGVERQGIRIMKLTAAEIAEGVTPKRIQEYADINGITVEEAIAELKKELAGK